MMASRETVGAPSYRLDMSEISTRPAPAPPTDPVVAVIEGSLSPSRAGDFKTCPLLYRFRTIDRLPETPDRAATRGTVVHAVLQQLFDRPAPERTPEVARSLVDPVWAELIAAQPEVADLFADDS